TPAPAPAADDAFGDLFGGTEAVAEPAVAPGPVVAAAEGTPAPAGDDFDALVGSLTEGEEAAVLATTTEPAPAVQPEVPASTEDGMALDDDMFKSLVDDAKKDDMRSAPANAASEVAADPFVGGSPVAQGDGGTPSTVDKFMQPEVAVGTEVVAGTEVAAGGAARGQLPQDAIAFEEAERLKREAKEYYATSALSGAQQALREKDYPRAIKLYEEARNNLPKRPETEEARAQTIKGLGAAYYLQALSQERAGDLENAKISASSAVKFGYVRAEESVVRIQSKIDAPPVAPVPPAKRRWKDEDYKVTQSQVKEWLKRGREAYLTGEYEQAILHFESVLKRDPENKEAIRLMHSAANKQYDRSSMELAATSARMMATVRDTWNPRQYGLHEVPIDINVGTQTTKPGDETQRQAILNKMSKIRIPEIEFRQANFRDVIIFLVQQSRDFDPEPDKSNKKGVNIILKLESDIAAAAGGSAAVPDPFATPEAPADGGGGAAGADSLITFSALDITLKEALDIVVEMGKLKYLVRGNAVMVMPVNAPSGDIEHRWYDVLPTAIERLQQLSSAVVGNAGPRGGFVTDAQPSAPNEEVDLKVFFQEMGVDWPDKSSIKFVRALGKLVVANTLENLTVFEKVLSILNVVPYQIEIEARFIEVAQLDVDSLGLEWLLNDNWEIAQKKGSAGSPLGAREQIRMDSSAANGGFTAGNRYLSADGLTGPGGVPIIDQVASITSVLTNPELTMVLHALQQRGATDLLSAPKITTQSGQQATIRVVTECIYPTEFETSGIGGSTTTTSGNNNAGGGVVGAVVTPSNFQMREVGVILKVTPSVSPEGQMIDLELNPEVVSEPTWRNYGSTYTSYDPNGNPVIQSLNMEQPFFHTRRLETKLLIYNGATVVMGGMITEVRREVDDKIPLLGDIPLVGRLFRSQYESSEKRNLLIFVTARLVDPSGRALDRERVGIGKALTERIAAGEQPVN
ncbi:MAG TPA: hypothetical protein DCS43_00875, partial [Verrucomicrobia bacterium]|nr:hypothetical protein [Verrucomicrobiota bacterium]